jgi:hypothetical protein
MHAQKDVKEGRMDIKNEGKGRKDRCPYTVNNV